jgi:hypothetical protein
MKIKVTFQVILDVPSGLSPEEYALEFGKYTFNTCYDNDDVALSWWVEDVAELSEVKHDTR